MITEKLRKFSRLISRFQSNGWSSKTCGSEGVQIRTRIWLLSFNGLPALANNCWGKSSETRKCNQLTCPINGGWWMGRMVGMVKCSTCVNSFTQKLPMMKNRTRACNNPRPSNGGSTCYGDTVELAACMKVKFWPIDGGFNEWSSWSQCSVAWGQGIRMRKRNYDNP